MARLIAANSPGGGADVHAAQARTSLRSWPAGTILFISPHSSASWALSRRSMNQILRARFSPITLVI